MRIQGVEICNIKDRDTTLRSVDEFDRVTGRDFSLTLHREIKPRSLTLQESLHQVRTLEANPELETGHARLGHDELRRADAEAISNRDLIFEQTFARKIFAESSGGEIRSRKLALPKRLVLAGVDINGLVDSAMHRKIGLAITIQVERCHMNAALKGLLPDGSLHGSAVPDDFSRKTYVDGNQLHDHRSINRFKR